MFQMVSQEFSGAWIPKCITGEAILALAMTEPEVGSDIARLTTTARREGDHYIVNGTKTFISNGQLADFCIVAVRTSDTGRPHNGISLLLIEAHRKGYRKGANLSKPQGCINNMAKDNQWVVIIINIIG